MQDVGDKGWLVSVQRRNIHAPQQCYLLQLQLVLATIANGRLLPIIDLLTCTIKNNNLFSKIKSASKTHSSFKAVS